MRKLPLGIAVALLLASTVACAGSLFRPLFHHVDLNDNHKRVTEFANELYLVHGAYCSDDIENGVEGSSTRIAAEREYTLRALPNQIRALAVAAGKWDGEAE